MERVIVLVEPSLLQHDETGRFAARFDKLGLTCSGKTQDEAIENLKRLFVTFVRTHRERGALQLFLEKTGLEWYTESNYPHDKSNVEYLEGPRNPWRPVGVSKVLAA